MGEASVRGTYEKLFKEFGPQGWWPVTPAGESKPRHHAPRGSYASDEARFEIMLGAILTQNTSWNNVEKALENIHAKKLCSPKALSKAPLALVKKCVRPSGYFNQKAVRVKNFAVYVQREYGGDLKKMFSKPAGELRAELLSINGVGPETADSMVLYAAEKPVFVIDSYTRRVFTRLGFLKGSESYDDIQSFFEKNLLRDVKLFNEYHALVVELGKSVCLKNKPSCAECPLRVDCVYAKKLF
jgi:endonuclease-3 related protein